MFKKCIVTVFGTLILSMVWGINPSIAQTKANKLFGAKSAPSHQDASPFGSYAKGCLAGAQELPQTGATWQAMRLSRHRNFGHPEMISFLKRLSVKAAQVKGWKGLYVGDISQPRGGPMLSGHQSHQMGLDADIWMLPPKRLDLSRAEREKLSSISVRSKNLRRVNGNWTAGHMAVLKAAASDPAVDRIFVTAPAKIWMCKNARGNKKWLQKIRPYWGHHYHFHVRLKCPKGSVGCKKQKPTVAQLSKNATGCDKDLNWWVTAALQPPDPKAAKKPKKPRVKKRGARDYVMADLPNQCRRVLASK
ncbi:MAG: penicillin-insensitive murein endopeptidase [Rhodobacteraceae bacterium]|nr:MAG: penicillin-insensitive murein endopeptidase [Paracoccaceae bacterium]